MTGTDSHVRVHGLVVYPNAMATDAFLDGIQAQTRAAEAAIIALYDAIRDAKNNGYSYNELEYVTGFPRGTIQNIAAGRNPRFTVE